MATLKIKPTTRKIKWLFKSVILFKNYPINGELRNIPKTKMNSEIWIEMNKLFRFNLKYLTLRGLIRSPILETVTGPHLINYQISKDMGSKRNRETAANYYSQIFDIDVCKFHNGLNYYLIILSELFDDIDFRFVNGSKILQVGPGIGLLDLFLSLEGAEMYSFETHEMRILQNLITSQVQAIDKSTGFKYEDYTKLSEPFGVISFFAFTEMDLDTRTNLLSIFERADWLVIVSNYLFEGIENFSYLESTLNDSFKIAKKIKIGDLDILGMPNFARQHVAYLFLKR